MPENAAAMPADPDQAQPEIDAVIALCGGDLRASIATLLADNAALQRELDFASLTMSYGFSRGWFARERERRALASSLSDDSPCAEQNGPVRGA